MNQLNHNLQEKRQTLELINSILETEELTPKERKRLEADKTRCELEIKRALKNIKK